MRDRGQSRGKPRDGIPLARSVTVAPLGDDTKAIVYLYADRDPEVTVSDRHVPGAVASAAVHALGHFPASRAFDRMAVRCCASSCAVAVAWLASLAPAVEVADTA